MRTEIKKEPTALNEIRPDEEAYLPVSLEDSITHIEKLIALQSDNKVDRTITEKPAPSRRLQSPKTATTIRILEFHEHLTVAKYKPAPGAVKISPSSMNAACRVFGAERAIELGLVRKSGPAAKTGDASMTRDSLKKPLKTLHKSHFVNSARSKPKIRLGKRSLQKDNRKFSIYYFQPGTALQRVCSFARLVIITGLSWII